MACINPVKSVKIWTSTSLSWGQIRVGILEIKGWFSWDWKFHRKCIGEFPTKFQDSEKTAANYCVRQISICYFVYTELMMCHNPDLGSASDWMKQISNQSEVFPDLGSGMTSVWNFCTCFSEFISRRNHQ